MSPAFRHLMNLKNFFVHLSLWNIEKICNLNFLLNLMFFFAFFYIILIFLNNIKLNYMNNYIKNLKRWGFGIGDWGLGIGD